MILVVDDEVDVRAALRRALGRYGLRVLTAESGAAGLALLASLSTEELPQVVLSDHLMAPMDGVAFLTEVRARWPAIQRVLLTGYADLPALERAVNEAHISRFLNKPWEDVALVSKVRSALEQWQVQAENQRLMSAMAEHNRLLEDAVAERTRELLAAQVQWERTFNAIADPVMLIDREYRVLRGNQALLRHLRAPGEVLGQRCHEVRAASRHPLPRSAAGPCLGCPVSRTDPGARGAREPAESELQGEGRALVVRAYPSEENTVCVYRDVTPERAAMRKLQVADRLAAIGQLAGGVAHELNNPLGGILASAQILQREAEAAGGAGEEQREFLREIEAAARRCKGIVESLLRFSRAAPDGREDPGLVQLNRLVQAALPLVSHQYGLRGVHLTCELDPALPPVRGIEAQLQQVLMTLLSNAFDANRAQAPPRPRRILLATAGAAGWARLTVRDEGPGFSEEQLTQLFTPFVSSKPPGQGTGLGLAVSYGIVSDHGGTLEARNHPEGGAELRVTLPALPV